MNNFNELKKYLQKRLKNSEEQFNEAVKENDIDFKNYCHGEIDFIKILLLEIKEVK